MITHQGIEVNPGQISAIEWLKATEQSKGGAEVDWDDSCIKSIWVEVSRQMPPLLLVVEEMEGVPMDGGMWGSLLGSEEVFSELTDIIMLGS